MLGVRDGWSWNNGVEKILLIHKAQLLGYMKLLDVLIGLLINFHAMNVSDGISRGSQPIHRRNNCELRATGVRDRAGDRASSW